MSASVGFDMACCATIRVCWDLISAIHADTGTGEVLKGVRREEQRREEELGTARGRERSILGGQLSDGDGDTAAARLWRKVLQLLVAVMAQLTVICSGE